MRKIINHHIEGGTREFWEFRRFQQYNHDTCIRAGTIQTVFVYPLNVILLEIAFNYIYIPYVVVLLNALKMAL